MSKYDAIVIGAGHNGLTNAAYLAKAGLNVLVLEKNAYIGGATVSRELYPDWKYSNCSYVCSLLRPEIIRDLELPRHGLQVVPYGGGVTFKENGDYFGNHADHERLLREIARHSKRDASAYERYEADVMKQTRLIRPFLMRTPPDPTSLKPKDLKELSLLAKSFGSMGEEGLADTMRFWTMSIGDFLDEYFESDVIKAHLAGSGIIGTALGVYSPGTAYVLLHHYMGDVDGSVGAWGFARGGMGSVSAALSKSFLSFGGTIKCDAEVGQIIVKNGKTKGVALANGDELYADIVVSNFTTQIKVQIDLPVKRMELGESEVGIEFPILLQSLDLVLMGDLAELEFSPVVGLLSPDSNHGFVRQWKPYTGSIGKHIGYAIQWFLMALVLSGIGIRLGWKYRKKNIADKKPFAV